MIVLLGPTQPKFQGGIVEYTHQLAAAWQHIGIDATVVSFTRPYPSFLYKGKKRIEDNSLPSIAAQMPIIDWLCPCSWIGAWWTIRTMRPETLYVQWWTVFWALPFFVIVVLLRLTTRIRIVMIVHNVYDHESSWVNKLFSRMVLSYADSFFTHAMSLKRELKQIFPDKTVTVQLHPLPRVLPNVRVRSKKNWSHTVLFFGLVRPYKGLMTLLEAFAIARERLPRLRLIIAGEFWESWLPYEAKISQYHLESAVTIHNRFIPEREVANYFAVADVALFPYLKATGTASTKRALAYGVPIIASCVGDIPDLFALGNVGIAVPPGDREALAQALVDFYSKDVSYAKDITAVMQHLTWKRFAHELYASANTSIVTVFNGDMKKTGRYQYTALPNGSSYYANKRITNAIASYIPKGAKQCIDVGCGDGTYTAKLAARFPRTKFFGFDPAQEAIAFARTHFPSISFFTGDIVTNKNVPHKTYDAVVVRGVLHHLTDPQKGITHCAQLGKRIIVVEPNGNNMLLKIIERVSPYHREHQERSFSIRQLEKWCIQARLRIVKKQYIGFIPFFFPSRAARAMYQVQPLLERIPVLAIFFGAQILLVCERSHE